MKTIISLATFSSLLFLAAITTPAEIMLSNLGETNTLVVEIGNEGVCGAIQFLTGSTATAWNLDAVTLEFGGPAVFASNNPILYNTSLYNDTGNAPGSQLAFLGSFDFTNQTAGTLQVTFNSSGSLSINPDSAYWIIVSAETTGYSGALEGTENHNNEVSGNGWQYGAFDWYYPPTRGLLPVPNPGTAFLEIEATAHTVPEPSGFVLAGLGVVAIFFCRLYKSPLNTRQVGVFSHRITKPRDER